MSEITYNGEITDPYRSFISKSRYSRWLDDEKRRETWEETVTRYVDFLHERMDEKYPGVIADDLWPKIHRYILDHKVMGSMRGLMTAGPALARDELSIFNCSYLAMDDVRAFDEAIYILCCGTGLGYSVENKHVSKLPFVANEVVKTDDVVVVEDSKEGWAQAFREVIEHLYNGRIPKIDISKVRGEGARLKTFGGRASGPQPLVDLIDFTVGIFKNAGGRQLTSLEVHDIMCKIGEIVVVGGVRRSALISLSDQSDQELATAKSGEWWKTEPQRSLANNSAVYDTKPELGTFCREWANLYDSKSGERGIFNAELARNNPLSPRRVTEGHEFGTNPCGEIILRSSGLCNLTEVVIRSTDTLDDLEEKVEIATILGTIQSDFTDFRYLRPIWKQNAEEERLLGVSLTGIYDNALTNGMAGEKRLADALDGLREKAIAVNKELAAKMGINQSAAITCVKPSGTVSQLVDSASGIHPRYAKKYIRSVRGNDSDSLVKFLKEVGVPHEPAQVGKNTTVFYFPQEAPANSIVGESVTAIGHLNLWLIYKKHWTEHNPSVTISVREHEWLTVANWVYSNWDYVGGLSFLPYDEDAHTYVQPPYQALTDEEYASFLQDQPMPFIDWDDLSLFEEDDNTTGSQSLACVAGNCDVVNI